MKKACFLAALMLVASCGLAQIAEPAKPRITVWTDVKDAPADFAIQGEYLHSAEKPTLGGQVIALGNGSFRLVILGGGLPGVGWDAKTKIELDGKTEADGVAFTSPAGWRATLKAGVISLVDDIGQKFQLTPATRKSPTEGAAPPAGARVLFDGTTIEAWVNGQMDDRKLLNAGTRTKQSFTDFTLHVEFVTPFKPTGRGQDRGNSGVYLQDRYEIQILDSFGLKGLDNECGGIYKVAAPKVNVCLPPLTWQTYDIDFTADRSDPDGQKLSDAVVTVKHNGVLIHDKQPLKEPTGGGNREQPDQQVQSGPIQLQGHGNPVFFRNIWIIERRSPAG